jgi:D-glycero-D-manno-heptose 1,7-bisphosphate phosphatase
MTTEDLTPEPENPPRMKATPVLYLDLDGTVRKGFDELGRFVNSAADVQLFPHMPERLLSYRQAGYRIVGVSNQGGIALGLVKYDDVATAIMETHAQAKSLFDKIIFCQHHPNAKDPEYAQCFCRKPRIGMLVLAQCYLNEEYPNECYPPHLALMVGDRDEDRLCAANGGVEFMWAKDWRALPFTITVENEKSEVAQ